MLLNYGAGEEKKLPTSVFWPGEIIHGIAESDRTGDFHFHFGTPQAALVVKNPPASAGDPGSIPGPGRPPGEGNGSPLQDSCLENPMDGGAWRASVHEVTRGGHD